MPSSMACSVVACSVGCGRGDGVNPGPDAYGQIDYRTLIAWPERLQREAPLLQQVLEVAPSRRVLDLGCGSGEHTRFLTALGFDVTGVDASTSQLEAARGADPAGRYVQCGLGTLAEADTGAQGAALCVGNTLPHLCEEEQVLAFFGGLAGCLQSGAPFLLQLLNYDRILDRGERTFPPVVRPGQVEGEDTIFPLHDPPWGGSPDLHPRHPALPAGCGGSHRAARGP
jgi:glycine/sarcosine N-methyltransferase